MPLFSNHKITTEITTYLADYNDNKGLLELDSINKKATADRVLKKINDFIRDKKDDAEWAKLLLEMGEIADSYQFAGVEHSRFTETFYMIIHVIRRELDPDALQQETQLQNEALQQAKKAYLSAKKENKELTDIQQLGDKIGICIRKLAHLGEISPLLDLDIDDIAALYSQKTASNLFNLGLSFVSLAKSVSSSTIVGYQYAYVNGKHTSKTEEAIRAQNLKPSRHLPLVTQDGGMTDDGKRELLFENIFIANYYNNKRPETKDTSAPAVSTAKKTSPPLPANETLEQKKEDNLTCITHDFAMQLVKDLEEYQLLKKSQETYLINGFTSDIDAKKTKCNYIEKKLKRLAAEKTSTEKWLDFVIEIGTLADETQRNGTVCSGFTEVLYLILHKLRREIEKNSSVEFKEKLDSERKLLTDQEKSLRISKLKSSDSADEENVKRAQEKTDQARSHLAYLGDVDPLLAFHSAKLHSKHLYYGNEEKTPLLNDFRGFEYMQRKRPRYGYTESVCSFLPIVVQNAFVEIYEKKYGTALAKIRRVKEETTPVGTAFFRPSSQGPSTPEASVQTTLSLSTSNLAS